MATVRREDAPRSPHCAYCGRPIVTDQRAIERFGEPFCSEGHAEEFAAGVRAARVDAAARRPIPDDAETRPARARGLRWGGWIAAAFVLGLLAVAFVGGNSGSIVPVGGFLLTALLLLACPLAMYFMMRGMGGMHGDHSARPRHGTERTREGCTADSTDRRAS